MLTTYVLLHLVHLGCNISWICVACMLLTINYLTMQRNHFLYVLNQIELKIKPPDFALGEKVIPSVDQCKYLGIIISVKNCDADLKRQMRKYYANANMLLRKFSYCSPDVKCCMFKSYCSTMYCSSMWFDSTVTAMRKLKIAYNNGLRRILNLPKYNSASEMFVNLNIPSFDELLRKFVYSFKSRIQDSCNSLVNGIVKSSVPLFSKIWVWWNDILYT